MAQTFPEVRDHIEEQQPDGSTKHTIKYGTDQAGCTLTVTTLPDGIVIIPNLYHGDAPSVLKGRLHLDNGTMYLETFSNDNFQVTLNVWQIAFLM